MESLEAQVQDLEERIAQLTAPNEIDGRFSGEKFGVTLNHIRTTLPELRSDLIVVKASGKLLLDEKEPGEQLTRRDYLAQTMALLSQLGLNIFLIHGGQEQLDRAIEESAELKSEVKELAKLKNGAVRYTPIDLMPLVISISNELSDSLKQAILKAGGNANAYLSSLFLGKRVPDFFVDPKTKIDPQIADLIDTETRKVRGKNNFCYLPLDGRLRAIRDREARVFRYLRGEIDKPGAAPGHIVIRGFLGNYADPNEELGAKRKVDPRTREKEDPYRLNVDADNVAAAHVFYFSGREVVPVMLNGGVQLVQPKRVHLLEIARNGGLRSGPDTYDNIADLVTSELDVERHEIKGGMADKAKISLQVARALARAGVPSIVKIMHVRELLPYLLGNEPAIRSGSGKGYGTTFAFGGLAAVSRFYDAAMR